MTAIEVKFFGPLRGVVGCDALRIDVPSPASGDEAFEVLASLHPGLRQWRAVLRLAVNLEYVPFSTVLKSNDEISLIPPVSGG